MKYLGYFSKLIGMHSKLSKHWEIATALQWYIVVILIEQCFSNYGLQNTCVLKICPCGPSKIQKKNSNQLQYHSIIENLRVWKWHMAIAYDFFFQYWHFIKFINLSHSATKAGFKALWTWCFLPSFPCTSGAAAVTQPGTIQIQNRGPKYWTFSCIYDILNNFVDTQHAHWNGHILCLKTGLRYITFNNMLNITY